VILDKNTQVLKCVAIKVSKYTDSGKRLELNDLDQIVVYADVNRPKV
jgi:hypothetical protein